MLPDRFERIEVLFRGAMLRLYTRGYIRRIASWPHVHVRDAGGVSARISGRLHQS